ncbi:restriction endonuclease subunit S [Methanocaldococcus sp. 16A]
MITATHKGKYYDVEYSIVNVSELEGELRLDAEYYDPSWIMLQEKIENLNHDFLYNLASNKYSTFNPKLYDKFYYIEISNVDLITGDFEVETLPSHLAPSRAKKIVEKNDILISTVRPNRNAVAFIFEVKQKPLVASTGFCKLKIISNRIKPCYLFILFKTKYYRDLLVRKTTATMYPAISEDDIMNLKIPIPSDTFQKFIEKLVLKAYEERQKAEQLYKQAEEILLEELGLKNWKPKTKKIKIGNIEFVEDENISIRNLSEVIRADRLDAEYWEPKYDEIEELIKNYKNGYSTISKEFLHKTDKLKVDKEKYYNYVEISSVNISTGDFSPSYLRGEDLPANAKLKLDKNDLLVSKVRTYRKGIALIKKTYPNLIGSTAFVVLHEKENKKINIETLFVFLRTDIFSLWSYKFYTGTTYPTLTDEDILNLPIPLIEPQIQQKISQLIQQSFKARENSKKLLEIAKKTVEIYIEKDENEGLKYAKESLKNLNITL